MIRNKKLQELDLSLNSLIVFRRILVDPVLVPLRPLLDTETTDPIIQLRQYAEFTSRLFPQNMNLTEYLLKLVLEDDNFFMRMVARGEEPDTILQACVRNELSVIQRLATLKPVELMKEISYYGPLPEWKISKIDFAEVYFSRLAEIEKHGYGVFAQGCMFLIEGEKTIPAPNPDPVRLTDLLGYEDERREIIENTCALLYGGKAQNVLLYGDAGTGKSSAVKAIVNEYAPDGLRLIEITKEQIPQLPVILKNICRNPLKFILFLDGLSFDAADDRLAALKTVLEGSAFALPGNAAFYATSDNRQMIRTENGSSSEDMSLSERFSLHIGFSKLDKQAYLDMVLALAERAGLQKDPAELCMQAEQFALRRGDHTPRIARHFLNSVL